MIPSLSSLLKHKISEGPKYLTNTQADMLKTKQNSTLNRFGLVKKGKGNEDKTKKVIFLFGKAFEKAINYISP